MEGAWSWLPLAIAAVAFLGTAVVYLRGSADKGTIESQDRLIKAQGNEIADLNRRLTNAEVKVGDAEHRVTTVESENRVLRGSVAHVEELVALQTALDSHHRDTMTALRSLASAVGE